MKVGHSTMKRRSSRFGGYKCLVLLFIVSLTTTAYAFTPAATQSFRRTCAQGYADTFGSVDYTANTDMCQVTWYEFGWAQMILTPQAGILFEDFFLYRAVLYYGSNTVIWESGTQELMDIAGLNGFAEPQVYTWMVSPQYWHGSESEDVSYKAQPGWTFSTLDARVVELGHDAG
jgi:hypothetical protein